jgi:hypothetical protein
MFAPSHGIDGRQTVQKIGQEYQDSKKKTDRSKCHTELAMQFEETPGKSDSEASNGKREKICSKEFAIRTYR